MTDHYYTSETENVGQFRCETTFIPSNVTFATDLPASFEGRAEFPSPGVLLGSTLASCMMSLVSVVAARKGVDLKGMPGSTRYLAMLARGHMLQGHEKEAEEAWRRILDADPGDIDALRALGCRLAASGRPAEARVLLERAQAEDPTPYIEHLLETCTE